MISYLEEFLDHIIDIEGGYVNNPNDSGGETNYGITKKVARDYGWRGPMRELPIEFAKSIYADIYWGSLKLDKVEKIYPKIAKEMGDTGVNMGTKRSARFLQRCLNVLNNRGSYYKDITVDGVMGPQTLSALESYKNKRGARGEIVLLNMLNCLQGASYIELAERREKDESFVYGWFRNRVKIS